MASARVMLSWFQIFYADFSVKVWNTWRDIGDWFKDLGLWDKRIKEIEGQLCLPRATRPVAAE